MQSCNINGRLRAETHESLRTWEKKKKDKVVHASI
jgi:hypothetical protein